MGTRRGWSGSDQPAKGCVGLSSQNIPQAAAVALHPTKKDAFDLTSAHVFVDDIPYQRRVVELLSEILPQAQGTGVVKVYTQ